MSPWFSSAQNIWLLYIAALKCHLFKWLLLHFICKLWGITPSFPTLFPWNIIMSSVKIYLNQDISSISLSVYGKNVVFLTKFRRHLFQWKNIVHGILQARILEGGSYSLLQGIFLTQGLKPGIKPRSLASKVNSLPSEPPRKWSHSVVSDSFWPHGL